MIIRNDGTTRVIINDLVDTLGHVVELDPGASKTIFDEDAEKSAALKAFVDAHIITITGEAEPNPGLEQPLKDDTNKIFTFQTNMAIASPQRPTTAYAYLLSIADGGQTAGSMSGGANTKTYAINVAVNRSLGSNASLDSNDAVLKGSYNNYAVNDANFIVRGINTVVNNRSGGVLGMLDNLVSVSGKSGGTATTVTGMHVVAENYGTVSGEFGGVDVQLKNEGAVATTEYGVKIENLNNSLATAVTSAVKVANAGVNTGFTTGLDLNGATLVNEVVFSNGIKVTVAGDTVVFTNAGATKSATITLA